MSYSEFVSAVVAKIPAASIISFRHEDGKHFANLTDDITIIGNTLSKSVWVSWGSGHSSIVTL